MPRNSRVLLSQSCYHVMIRGNNKNIVFKSPLDYFSFLDLVKRYKESHPFNLYHYCLMPNHVHFLIQTANPKDFSLFMKKLNLSYFYHFKKQYGWTGHFWQDRYKSQPVGKDEYFLQCGKYIELNPVRANIVKNPEDYPYSSYDYYINGEANSLITKDFMFESVGKTEGERQRKYKNLVIGDAVTKNYKKTVWGSDNQRYNESKKIRYYYKHSA